MNTQTHQTPAEQAPKDSGNRMDFVRQMTASGKSHGLDIEGRKVVHISQIDEDPKNERKTFPNLGGMADSIRTFGVLEPPTVFVKPDGRFQILTGHRRVRAARIANLEKIEVLVRKADEEKAVRIKSIVSNVSGGDINPIQLATALQALLEDNTLGNQSALAETIGKHRAWVSKMLRILSLPPAIQERLTTSELLVSYDAVAEIARLDNPKQQERLIGFLLSGGSLQEVRKEIKAGRNGADAGQDGQTPVGPKPKYVFSTSQGATVIIQALDAAELSEEQKIAALQEALRALN